LQSPWEQFSIATIPAEVVNTIRSHERVVCVSQELSATDTLSC
jgi:hypothetical protein